MDAAQRSRRNDRLCGIAEGAEGHFLHVAAQPKQLLVQHELIGDEL